LNINFAFCLLDLTTDKTPSALRPQGAFQTMIDAWTEQLLRDFAPAWGMPSVSFRIGEPGGPRARQPNEIAMNFRDTIPEAPGDLAYHQVTAGIPDIEIGVDLFETLTTGPNAVSLGGGHEFYETLVDPGANQWCAKKDGTGRMGAKEVIDPVENTAYVMTNGTTVPNFVLPSYWMPGAPGPYDFMGKLAAPTNTEIEKYGYEIQAAAPGSTVQVGMRGLVATGFEVVGRKLTCLADIHAHAEWCRHKTHTFARPTRRGIVRGVHV